MNENLYTNLKKFWEKKIEKEEKHYGFSSKTPNWKDELGRISSLQLINAFSKRIRREIREVYNENAWRIFRRIEEPAGLDEKEFENYQQCIINDTRGFEKEIGRSGLEKDKLEESVNEYETGLKKVLGNNLDNWENQIVKIGSSDKDILGLRDQITGLTNEKKDLEKQAQQKTDQWNNHKCDTPNNAELNQVKDELSKMTQERNKLSGQLNQQPNQPNSNQPIPITPPLIDNKEEEEKERQENDQLSLEELKNKLEERQKEIRNLKVQLTETIKNGNGKNQSGSQTSSNPSNSIPKENSKLFLGIVIGVSVMAILGGLAFFLAKKKKKNRFI